ncbi:MAG: SBBP repeat-containing protein, partial [Ilumatobacteraceae bacterium]
MGIAAVAVAGVAVWGGATASTPPARLTLWTAQLGTSEADTGAAVAVGSNGMTCLYGQTAGEFVADVGSLDTDVFVACYDKLGTRKWVRQIGTSGSEMPSNSFAVANNGDVYIAGTTDGEFPDEFQEGGQDVFVAKFNKNGALRFVKQFGGRYDDQAWGLTRAPSGDLYLAVNTTSDDFPSGSLPANQLVGETDSAIVKLSRNADLKWARQFGSNKNDWAWNIGVTRKGEVYAVGSTFGDIDGAGSEVFHGGDTTKGDGFVLRFDRDGRRLWTRQIGGVD